MPSNENQVILQFIDRIVDENIRSAEALTALKFAIQEQRTEIADILDMLKNELRLDLKDHIDKKSDGVRKELIEQLESIETKFDTLATETRDGQKRNEEIDKVLTDIRKKGIWFRGIVATFAAVSTIVAGVIYFVRVVNSAPPPQPAPIVEPHLDPDALDGEVGEDNP